MNRKNTFVLLLLFLVYGLVYRFFFSDFLSNTSNFEQLNSRVILEKREALNQKIKQEQYLDSILSIGEINHKVFENELLLFINRQTDSLGIKLLGFTYISSSSVTDSFNSRAYKIWFQAEYFASLSFINQMEYEFPFSTLEHLSMTKQKPRRSRAVLHTEIIFFK